jgi:hypothetical protein
MRLFFKQRRSLTAPSSAAASRHNRGRTGRILIPGVAAGLMALTVGHAASAQAAAGTVPVNDSSFKCLKSMVKVRHFSWTISSETALRQ